jgi:hypothetical protein
MKHPSERGLDYPRLNDALFIIWSGNAAKWPDARRQTHFLSGQRRDIMRGFALFTTTHEDAATFDTEAAARAWLAEQEELRPHPYIVNVSTVLQMKITRGYADAWDGRSSTLRNEQHMGKGRA